jgi:hypothetical protein
MECWNAGLGDCTARRRPSTSLRIDSERGVNEFLIKRFSELCLVLFEVFAACANFLAVIHHQCSASRNTFSPRRTRRPRRSDKEEDVESEKKIFFLRALRVLRGDIHFSFLVVALSTLCPSCQICGRPDSLSYPRSSVVPAVAALGHKKA